MSSNDNSSQATGSTQQPPPTAGHRYTIYVDADGTIGGRDGSKWSSRCGTLIRTIIPISYKDWRQVGQNYKNDVWNSLVREFEMNLEPHVARPLVEGKFSQFFRSEKRILRAKIIRKCTDKRDAIEKCPDDVDKVWWAAFVENEWDDKKKEQCKKNAENRSKNTINHTLGRRSYSQVYETMEKDNPGANIRRVDVWKAAHKRKNGEVLPSAQEKYKQIEEEEEKRKAASDHGIATGIDDFEHDEVAVAFGPEKGNRCRAISSSSSVKQVRYGQAVKAVAKQKCAANLDEWQAKMEATVKSTVKESMKELATTYFGMQRPSPPQLDVSTPRTEGASNSVQNQISPHNLNNAFDAALSTPTPSRNVIPTSQSGRQYVMLLSREQKEVAKGYIFNHSGQCHMRVVASDERVVWVTEVKDPEAPMYEAPQNGLYKLCEISDGGFLIWLQSRLRYL